MKKTFYDIISKYKPSYSEYFMFNMEHSSINYNYKKAIFNPPFYQEEDECMEHEINCSTNFNNEEIEIIKKFGWFT